MRCANVVTRAFDRNRQINWHFSILFMSIQVTLPPSPEKWSARSKSCEHPNNWCRFHLRPFILRYSPWKITTNWQIWALVATLEGLPTNLAPAKVLSLTNVQHQNRWVSQPRAAGISSLYHQTYTKKKKEKNSDQWFDGRWFSSAPSKLHQLLFPKKKVLKKRHLLKPIGPKVSYLQPILLQDGVTKVIVGAFHVVFLTISYKKLILILVSSFQSSGWIIGLNKCLFHKEFTSQNSDHNSTRFGHLGPLKLHHLKTDGTLQSEALDDWYHALNPYKAWVLWLVNLSWSISS